MSNTPRNLTRNQLAEFLPNQRAVRAFEQLLKQVGDLLPSDIATINRLIQEAYIEASAGSSKGQSALDQLGGIAQDAAINAGAADQKATAALSALNRIADSLQLLATAPANKEDNSVSTDYVDFRDNGWLPSYKLGRVWFGPTGTLEVAMGNGNITQQVGEEFFRYGKASSAISDTNLQLVYKTGVVGASGVITFAPAVAGITDPDQILGVATEPIALNGFGRITTMGVVHGINTTGSVYGETWADNDDIWYNPVTGGLTKTKPSAPNVKVQIGTVINAGSGGSGSFSVKIGSSSSLGGTDSNVQLGSLANGDLLVYDNTLKYWKNVPVTGIGAVTSVGLSAPTGFSVSGSPVTSTGTLALSFAAGYSLPTNASQSNWDTAYADRNKWDGGSTGLVAATGRTSLGATTLGSNLFTITNPSSVTFPRFNADNTVSSLDAATFRSAIGAGTGSGDVVGPSSATANALVRFDATTGKLVKNSVGVLTDAGALSGLTQTDVGNVRTTGNTVSTTNTNGDLNLQPNGTGAVYSDRPFKTANQVQFSTIGTLSQVRSGTDSIASTLQLFSFTMDSSQAWSTAMVELHFACQQAYVSPGYATEVRKYVFQLVRSGSTITATTINSDSATTYSRANSNYGMTLAPAVTIVSGTVARFDLTITNSGAITVGGFNWVAQATVRATLPLIVT